MVFKSAFVPPGIGPKSTHVIFRPLIHQNHQHGILTPSSTELGSTLDGTGMLISSLDSQTAAALILPLLTYKVAATLRGQRLQWYLDASIALVITAFASTLVR